MGSWGSWDPELLGSFLSSESFWGSGVLGSGVLGSSRGQVRSSDPGILDPWDSGVLGPFDSGFREALVTSGAGLATE